MKKTMKITAVVVGFIIAMLLAYPWVAAWNFNYDHWVYSRMIHTPTMSDALNDLFK